jgi:hypothetical protein
VPGVAVRSDGVSSGHSGCIPAEGQIPTKRATEEPIIGGVGDAVSGASSSSNEVAKEGASAGVSSDIGDRDCLGFGYLARDAREQGAD